MVQNNHKHSAMRPQVRPVEQKIQKQECSCGENCKCGCNSGCSCNCGSNVLNGILVFIGTLLITGSILHLSCNIGKMVSPAAPQKAGRVAQPAPSDRAFKDFVKNNPQVIIDSVNAYYQKQQAAEKAAKPADRKADASMISAIIADKTNHVLGNPKGSFVMIEFFDYNCGYCKMMNKKMAEAVKKSNNIRWILIDTPIFGEKSEVISRYAYAAAKQGKYAEFHAALADASDKTETGLKEIGKKLGLNVEKLAKDANSDAAKKKLEVNREYTKKLQMGGVPMFIIDGQIQGGAFPDEQMDGYIKKANDMKKAKK